MKFLNDIVLKKMMASLFNEFNGKPEKKIRELEARIDELAKKLDKPPVKRGRPRKTDG